MNRKRNMLTITNKIEKNGNFWSLNARDRQKTTHKSGTLVTGMPPNRLYLKLFATVIPFRNLDPDEGL